MSEFQRRNKRKPDKFTAGKDILLLEATLLTTVLLNFGELIVGSSASSVGDLICG